MTPSEPDDLLDGPDPSTASLPEADRMGTTDVEHPRPSVPLLDTAGVSIGRYLVFDEVGRGGMGRVLRAYDPKLQREVALKVLHTARVSPDTQGRLMREARAMAKLSHPNVVAVYDVELETREGVVIAMEFVEGTTLYGWLRSAHPWAEIVERFVEAGRGLAAAHAVGMLHRDFKPGNVLLGNDGRVRVTDFGLARPPRLRTSARKELVHEEPTELLDSLSHELTEEGAVMGTPRFMSPEQHEGDALDASTDQYAFCVALWAALTGKPPFAGRFVDLLAAKRQGPPPWPNDRAVPRRIVDALVRGLSPGRRDRFADMDALLDELQPRPTRWRWLVGGGAALGLAASVFSWPDAPAPPRPCQGAPQQLEGHWDEQVRGQVSTGLEATGLPYAEDVATRVEQTLDRYAEAWVREHTDACEATAVRKEQSTALLDLRMACLNRARVSLRVSAEVLAAADEDTVRGAHTMVEGLPSLSRCADVEALQAAVPRPRPEDEGAVAATQERLSRVGALLDAGRYDDAALELARAEDEAEGVEHAPLRTEIELVRGRTMKAQGDDAEAEAAFGAALRSGLANDQWGEVLLAATLLVETVGGRQARPGEGLAYAQTAWAMVERASDDPVGEARLRHALAAVAQVRGELAAAESEDRAALELQIRHAGAESTLVATARRNLATVLQERGKPAEAERELRAALAVMQQALGDSHPEVAMTRNNLANAMADQGRHDEAVAELRGGLASLLETVGDGHPHVALTRANLAAELRAQGHPAEARVQYVEALAALEKTWGPSHPNVAMTRSNLANVLADLGHYDEAEVEYRAALRIFESTLGLEHPVVARLRGNLAGLLWRRDASSNEALTLAEQAWAAHADADVSPDVRADSAFLLARILGSRDRARARELGERALGIYQGMGEGQQEALAKVQAWLDGLTP
ncbi:MAG: serine/threonine-protein kinase [Myxococcota bacterium]